MISLWKIGLSLWSSPTDLWSRPAIFLGILYKKKSVFCNPKANVKLVLQLHNICYTDDWIKTLSPIAMVTETMWSTLCFFCSLFLKYIFLGFLTNWRGEKNQKTKKLNSKGHKESLTELLCNPTQVQWLHSNLINGFCQPANVTFFFFSNATLIIASLLHSCYTYEPLDTLPKQMI